MCKDQKGGWCKLLVKKNGTIRVQHLKQYDLGCYRCHKLKQVRISELGQARIFYSFVCFSDPSFFYPAKGLHSGGLNQRYTAGKKPIFFVHLFTLMSNHQENCFLTISSVKYRQHTRFPSMKRALGAGCLRAVFLYLLYPNLWHVQFKIQLIKDYVSLKILARHTICIT